MALGISSAIPVWFPECAAAMRSEEHTSELQSRLQLVCRLLLEKKNRYTLDADSRTGWLWPVAAIGEPLAATSYMAVGFSVAKYATQASDMDLAATGLGDHVWTN